MKIKDQRYDYHITVSAHIIIEDENGRILMTKRPDTWEWAPGRWGLVGGKLYKYESFAEAIKRKTLQELGFELQPDGLFKLVQLIIEDKQAHMYFFVAKYKGQKITGEMIQYRWFGKESINSLKDKELTEYFYKKLLMEYLTGDKDILPSSKIESLNYIELGRTQKYKKWFKGIINKDYDPNKIADYKKWEKRASNKNK